MKTSVEHTLENYVGDTYLLPLFEPLTNPDEHDDGQEGEHHNHGSSYTAGNGNGSHYYYNIVQFVAVKLISSVTIRSWCSRAPWSSIRIG